MNRHFFRVVNVSDSGSATTEESSKRVCSILCLSPLSKDGRWADRMEDHSTWPAPAAGCDHGARRMTASIRAGTINPNPAQDARLPVPGSVTPWLFSANSVPVSVQRDPDYFFAIPGNIRAWLF